MRHSSRSADRRQSKITHEDIPNSELAVFENSGHFTHVEEPEAFVDAVRGWLHRS